MRPFLYGLIFAVVGVAVSACGSSAPKWQGKIYQGDPVRGGIQRTQEMEFISAHDPIFKNFSAIETQVLIDNITRLKNSCAEWKPGTEFMSQRELKKLKKDLGQ